MRVVFRRLGSAVAGMTALIAGAASAAAQPAPAQAAAPSPQAWRAMAIGDVGAAYDIYAADHPGMHDPANPAFPARLLRARAEALAAAGQVGDYATYVDALGTFTAVLADGHAQILPGGPPPSNAVREWPGFIAAWRGDRMLVHRAEPASGAHRGDVILACDGRPIADYVRHRLRTRRFRPLERGDWWLRGPLAFVSNPGLAAGRPERCTFRRAGGPVITTILSWRAAPEGFNRMLELATDGEQTEIGLTEPRPGLFLLGMPDFPSDPAGVRAFRAMFDALAQRRSDLLRARAIVIDLRHNNGGASIWSRQAARALWGTDAVESAMHAFFRRSQIWWRASAANIAALAGIESQVRASGDATSADRILAIAEGMRRARARGQLFDTGPAEVGPAPPAARTDLRTPVYVIVPGRCASACLDALDIFTRFENVTLIGAPSSADSAYLEVRPAPLPSGRAQLLVPVNLWIRRPRAPGQIYRPAIPLNDLDWSTSAFLDRIERDLARRGRGTRRR